MNNNKNTEKTPINTKDIMSMDELKKEFFKSLAVCEGCDHKLGCPVYPRAQPDSYFGTALIYPRGVLYPFIV